MNLGERIYQLRTEHNLSQGDLAEKLDVSRQSISKWENNSATPDLEKIIKLSEIFSVSLDELIKGEKPLYKTEPVTPPQSTPQKESGFPPRKIAGTILLCMAFLTALILLVATNDFSSCLLAMPFLTCGILCFILKRNIGLWCAWNIFFLLSIYLPFNTGINLKYILYFFQSFPEMNLTMIVSVIFLLAQVALIGITIVRFGKASVSSEKTGRNHMLLAWSLFAILQLAAIAWGRSEIYRYMIETFKLLGPLYLLINIVLNWLKMITFTAALVFTMQFVNYKRYNLNLE